MITNLLLPTMQDNS